MVANFFVFEVDDVFGVRHNGRGVRSHEEFVVLAHADDERRRFAGGDEAVGMGLVHHDQRIRAHNFLERRRTASGKSRPVEFAPLQ